MTKETTLRLARVLRVLVTVTFICNLLVLPLVPVLVSMAGSGVELPRLLELLSASPPAPEDDWLWFSPGMTLFLVVWGAWTERFSYCLVLTLFLLFCGVCTAVILWQARRVLGTVLAENTFTRANAANMGRAAVCCLLISAAALARTIWGLWYYRSPAPLLTYNALFVPIFLMGGLVCLVLSALVGQAARLQEENDLTI